MLGGPTSSGRGTDLMAFHRAFAGAAPDGMLHREEEITLARVNSRKTGHPGTTSSAGSKLEGVNEDRTSSSVSPTPPKRRRVVLPDPVAFKFLEEDPSITLIERKQVLRGYELYLVEQWVCSRQSPTLVIVTYTGDPNHSIVVGVLGVPVNEKDWSPRLRVYFKAIQQYHARPKETEIGELMVTNLSSFPSALTVIAVPDGDIRKHRQIFIINENLKRLGCSGRSGMTLSDPTSATQAKFLQLYKTSDRIPFFQSVLELVRMCQIALFMFGKLEQEYIDGLLCDVTETAINNWWTETGSEYYNIEPTDGILGPTTVAALLGTLMGARNRLSYFGAPITKDVFDLDNMKKGISSFQKAYKLERTRRLDRQTLLRLHNVTAKAAAGEGGWGVQKAVKSTVAEIGGKRGELVIGMVGGKDKAGIGDIETAELDKFISLAYGERAKWLWHGKPRRTASEPSDNSMAEASGLLFGKESREDMTSGLATTSRRTQSLPLEEALSKVTREEDSRDVYMTTAPGSVSSMADSPADREQLRKAVFKSVAGKVSDARTGFGRIRDAVGTGLRGHASRASRDEGAGVDTNGSSGWNSPIATLAQSSAALSSPVMVNRAFTWKNKPEEYSNGFKKERDAENAEMHPLSPIDDETPNPDTAFRSEPNLQAGVAQDQPLNDEGQQEEIRKELVDNDPSVAGSVIDDGDLQGPLLAAERTSHIPLTCLQRRHSINLSSLSARLTPDENRWARRLSFSDAEEAILRWEEVADLSDTPDTLDTITALQSQQASAEMARHLYAFMTSLQTDWVASKVEEVEALDSVYGQQYEQIHDVYFQLSDAYARLKHTSSELLTEERAGLAEAVKDVEGLVAKLEYEINTLVSKVADVEDGVAQFEVQVEQVERRADELKAVLETESWVHWFVRTLTGIGTGPNITREGPI